MIIILLLGCAIIALICSIIRQTRKNRDLLRTVTKLHRGTRSERDLILRLLKHGIPAITIFHDLYVKKFNSNYSQIDVVVATTVGIIVFEVKNYSGWLFGKGYQSHWMQVLAYGREKHKFYNPIRQNDSHCISLRRKLALCANVPFYSVIVFYGNCVFRNISSIPESTYIIRPKEITKVFDRILATNPPANYTSKREVVKILKEAVQNGDNPAILLQHVQNIHQMLNRKSSY